MTVGTLIYLLLFLAGLFISIFYVAYGTVAIMGILIAIPIAMLLFLIFVRSRIRVSVDSKNPIAEKDAMDKPARASITLSVENGNRILPITKGIAKVRYENIFSGEKGKMKVRFSVDAGRKRDRRILVPMMNCGNVAITVEKVRIYDYLSIFAWTVGKNFETQNVLILPPLREMYLGGDRWYNETNEDSDRFSLYKKGDDPSEIFDIREYMDGDKIQRIHWKLSSKTGSLMVKEGSLPLTKAVNIFIDLCVQGTREKRHDMANRLVQGIYSIAMFMIEHGIPQKYIWYDEEKEVVQERLVEHEEELLWMFQDLFRCRVTGRPEALVDAYLEWEEGKTLESALYLTVADHGNLDECGLVRERLEVMDLRGEELEDEK
jgi:hypothetical protein